MINKIKNIISKLNPVRIGFNFLRRYEAIVLYQGSNTTYETSDWSTKSHIRWSFIFALVSSLLGFVNVWILFLYPITFLLHSPLTELVFQYYKEKNKRVWNVVAQILERGVWHGLLLPLPIIVLVLALVFNIQLI